MAKSSEKAQLGYIHLRVHSSYSLLEGALPIATLAGLAKQESMPALAITDTNNLFGALEFSEAMAKEGIQPIIGCSLAIKFEKDDGGHKGTINSDSTTNKSACTPDGFIAVLAKNEIGYRNLMVLSSLAFLENADISAAHVKFSELATHNEGLICLTGGPDGPIGKVISEGDLLCAEERLTMLERLFSDRLYVELQRHGNPRTVNTEKQLLKFAYDMEIPLVATNEAYFARPEDYDAHDALICIAEGRYISEDDRRRLTSEHYFKSQADMMKLFADIPEALENTIEIARRTAFRPRIHDPILPQFVKQGKKPSSEEIAKLEGKELKKQAQDGLKSRLSELGVAEGKSEEDYWNRLQYELQIIEKMQYPGYFLIVADFIKWAKSQSVPVGPGRGSGAGSVVAWALTITDLDPLKFGLLFERFLNPERISMPDFDIDFCQERRDEVIQYVVEKYGKDRVAQIITFGKLQARAALRDVGRVLHMPYGQVDRLCKLVPNNPANPVTLAEAISSEARLQEERDRERIVARLLDIGQRLEGLYRHASTHAAGVVISDRPLTELVPLYRDPKSNIPATQFNMKWAEAAGLVKFDFLGLKTLTVIEKTKQLIAKRGIELDLETLPLDDEATFDLIARGDTVGVFQLEGSGMRESLRNLRPDRFEDIIAMVALYRPGPMDNIETYINRKFGRETPNYLHPLIEPILKETYGVIIYQEQVMQVAQTLSGYSLGEADLLRRAMGKKIKAEMDKQKSRFIEGATANEVERSRAEFIFELVAKFAGYGFNKSHAAAYAVLAYQTAYLKANYPVEFLAASMTLDMGNTDKLNIFVQEAKRSNIDVLPPCVNESESNFKPLNKAIRYSLAALKNIGRQAVEHVCTERNENGPFRDIGDFARRINPRSLNKRALETMAASGAFDSILDDRARVYHNVDRILAESNKSNNERVQGQNDLFGSADAPQPLDMRPAQTWLPMEKLSREFDAIGFFLSGHPLDEYKAALTRLGVESWSKFAEKVRAGRSGGLLAATVTYVQERKSKTGNKFAFAGFSDSSGQFEAVIFSDTLSLSGDLLEPGTQVLLRVDGEMDGDSIKTRVQSLEALDKVALKVQGKLRVVVSQTAKLGDLADHISDRGTGKISLLLDLEEMERQVEVTLPGNFDVSPRRASALRTVSGVIEVQEV